MRVRYNSYYDNIVIFKEVIGMKVHTEKVMAYNEALEKYNLLAKYLKRPLKEYGDFITLGEMEAISRAFVGLEQFDRPYADLFGWGPPPSETIDLSNERAEN
jgi:hypothetical protein